MFISSVSNIDASIYLKISDNDMTKKFTVCYTLEVTLSIEDLWPDGDAPDNPTEEDVEALIESDGGFPQIIDDWSLDDAGEYSVFVDEGDDEK